MPSLNVTSTAQFGELRKILDKNPLVLVLVYADWCGHCQHFKPEWKNLANSRTRNMAMVSVRDDVFPKSPLNSLVTPEGFPTVAVVSKANNVAVNLPSREPTMLNNLVSNADKISPTMPAVAAAEAAQMNSEAVAAVGPIEPNVSAATTAEIRLSGTDNEDSLEAMVTNSMENAKANNYETAPVRRAVTPPLSEEEYLRMNISKKPLPLVRQAGGSGLWNILQSASGPMQPFSIGGMRRLRTPEGVAKRRTHRRLRRRTQRHRRG